MASESNSPHTPQPRDRLILHDVAGTDVTLIPSYERLQVLQCVSISINPTDSGGETLSEDSRLHSLELEDVDGVAFEGVVFSRRLSVVFRGRCKATFSRCTFMKGVDIDFSLERVRESDGTSSASTCRLEKCSIIGDGSTACTLAGDSRGENNTLILRDVLFTLTHHLESAIEVIYTAGRDTPLHTIDSIDSIILTQSHSMRCISFPDVAASRIEMKKENAERRRLFKSSLSSNTDISISRHSSHVSPQGLSSADSSSAEVSSVLGVENDRDRASHTSHQEHCDEEDKSVSRRRRGSKYKIHTLVEGAGARRKRRKRRIHNRMRELTLSMSKASL